MNKKEPIIPPAGWIILAIIGLAMLWAVIDKAKENSARDAIREIQN